MLCPVEGWGQTAGISRWGMNTMPTFLVRSWCQDLLTHDLTSQWRGFQFHRNSGHLSNISATEIVRSSVLTNKIANSKPRKNGTNSMPATVKPQFLTLPRWRQRSCQGWSCRVTSPQQEVGCIGDYQTITLSLYICIYIYIHFFCGFSGLSSWKRGKLPCSTWCMMLGSLEITNSTHSYALHMSHHESQVFRHHLSDTTMLISTSMGPKEIVNIAQWHGRDARGQPSPRKQCNASKHLCVRGCQAGG